MKSFFGAAEKKKGNFHLVANVDEYSITFLLLRVYKEGFRVERYGSRQSGTFPGTLLLSELLLELGESFVVKELVVSFTPPYFEIHSSQASISRTSKTSEITKGECSQLEAKMVEQAERQLRARLFEDSGILPNDFVIQRADVFRWKIDGYAVERPEGFRGQRVESSVLGIFLRQDYADFIGKLQKKHALEKVSATHPFEGVQKQGKAGVFVYFCEKKTQVLVVKKELFHLTESFAPGGNRFRDVFQEEFGMSENIAQDFEERYITGKLSEEAREKLRGLLLPQAHQFGTLIKEKLGGVYFAVPPQVFIFGSGVHFPEATALFGQGDAESLPFSEQPTVEILTPKDFHKNFLPKELGPLYTPILFLIEARYAKKTH